MLTCVSKSRLFKSTPLSILFCIPTIAGVAILIYAKELHIQRKCFYISVKENALGPFVTVTEVKVLVLVAYIDERSESVT